MMANVRCTGAELEPEADVPAGKTRLYSNFNVQWSIRLNLYHVKCLVKLMRLRNSCRIITSDHTVIERKLRKRYPDVRLTAVSVRENWAVLKRQVSVLVAMKLAYGITVDPHTGLLNCTDEQWGIIKGKFYTFNSDKKRYRNFMDIQELQWAMVEMPNFRLDTTFFRDQKLVLTIESMLNGTEVNGVELCKQRLRLRNVYIAMPLVRPGILPELESNESNQIVLYKPKKQERNTKR